MPRTKKRGTENGAVARARLREKPQQIADEVRQLIISGKLADGESLGHEPDLVERFGVSRPSLREALRILEAEGLITVVRGMLGGVVAHHPDGKLPARTAALVLQARHVPLADVHEARSLIELAATRLLATRRARRAATTELRRLIDEQVSTLDDPVSFARANARFHDRLVALAGNQTLGIVAEMLNEVVARAVAALSETTAESSMATRRRGTRSQERLVTLIEAGKAAEAEQHWARHMEVVSRVLLGPRAGNVVDLTHHH